jgi:hypothetical protein
MLCYSMVFSVIDYHRRPADLNIEELISKNDEVLLWMFLLRKISVIFGTALLKIRMSDPRQQPAENPGMSVIKLFLAGNTSAQWFFFPDQGQKMPGNPEIPRQPLMGITR